MSEDDFDDGDAPPDEAVTAPTIERVAARENGPTISIKRPSMSICTLSCPRVYDSPGGWWTAL